MNYEYAITNDEGKYYQSRRDYVSADCRWVDYEIDATFMDESDLLYILNESDIYFGKFSLIHVATKNHYVGFIPVDKFKEAY